VLAGAVPLPYTGAKDTVADTSTIEKLRRITFFTDIADADLRQVAEIIKEKAYPRGAVIIEEHTEADRFFIIFRGKIEIAKRLENEERFVLSVQSDGDFFGEMALLDEQPRSATATALEPTTVMEIMRKDFETLLYKAPMLAFRIIKELVSRLRETNALLVSHLQQRNRMLYRSHIDTIMMVVQSIEKRDAQTRGRTRRMAGLGKAIAGELALPEEQMTILELSMLLHDLGMFEVPENLLQKLGPLAEGELAAIREHPLHGKDMIQGISILEKTIPDVLHHHEKFNGTGYPAGLAGTSIPLASRIIAVVDAYEAMTRGRPYRDRLGADAAAAEIIRKSGIDFDPTVVGVFKKLWKAGRLPAVE
jgi:HD-GYP domain-containing protein (c-di-GMP phosphodiesterase class II)